MAIVKTDDTSLLAGDIASALFDMQYSLYGVTFGVMTAVIEVNKLAEGQYSNDGSTDNDTKYWKTTLGSTTASYEQAFDGYYASPGDYYGALQDAIYRQTLSGTDLDLRAAGGAVATRYTYTGSYRETVNTAGYTETYSVQDRMTASIDYDFTGDLIDISQFSYTSASSEVLSGYRGGRTGAIESVSENISRSFVGLATFAWNTLNSLSINSFASSSKYTGTGTGDYEEDPWSNNSVTALKISSVSGFNFSAGAYSGALDSILYSNSVVEFTGYASAPRELDYFKYADTSAAGDELDIEVLQGYNALNSEGNRNLWMAELLKGNDTILVSDNDGGMIYAGAGDDKVTGAKGNDDLYGGAGNDVMSGGAGNDYLQGDEGNDTLKGGAGDDEIYGDDGDDVIDGGTGNDSLEGNAGDDRLLAGLGNDYAYGGDGSDYIDGGAGNDELDGGLGNDILKGGAGNDQIWGDQGDDIIDGGAGNDLIVGGRGVDVMTGGSGIDGFYFEAGHSGLTLETLDQIKGFNVAQDQILFGFSVTEADISVLATSATYDALLIAAQADDARIVVGYDAGNTYVFVDTDGANGVDMAVQLVGIKGAAVADALTFKYLPL